VNYIQDPVNNPHRPASGTELCPAAEVAPGVIKRFRWGPADKGFRAFLIQSHGEVRGYIDWCPHWGIPLQDERDEIFQEQGLVVCAWHWARYSPQDGKGVDGPTYEGLRGWAVMVGEDGLVRTA
jgi:nitrite reductase/ring-hydroxylating ferredoxin subunit